MEGRGQEAYIIVLFWHEVAVCKEVEVVGHAGLSARMLRCDRGFQCEKMRDLAVLWALSLLLVFRQQIGRVQSTQLLYLWHPVPWRCNGTT
jgi:hypothetical protein